MHVKASVLVTVTCQTLSHFTFIPNALRLHKMQNIVEDNYWSFLISLANSTRSHSRWYQFSILIHQARIAQASNHYRATHRTAGAPRKTSTLPRTAPAHKHQTVYVQSVVLPLSFNPKAQKKKYQGIIRETSVSGITAALPLAFAPSSEDVKPSQSIVCVVPPLTNSSSTIPTPAAPRRRHPQPRLVAVSLAPASHYLRPADP